MTKWIILLTLFAFPAFGASDTSWKAGENQSLNCGNSLTSGERCYWRFGIADVTPSSPVLQIAAQRGATICLEPDHDGTNSAAEIEVRQCVSSDFSDLTYGDNTCPVVAAGVLTDATRCVYEVPNGKFYIKVTTAAGAATAVVSAQGQ